MTRLGFGFDFSGDKHYFYVKNEGIGVITLEANQVSPGHFASIVNEDKTKQIIDFLKKSLEWNEGEI